MQLLNSTQKNLSSFAAYCRTGKLDEIPGIHKENISHYRKLVFNVIDDTLQNAYPLTHELLSAKEWQNVVNDFFSNHPCQSPQVWSMPKELYEYLSKTHHPLLKKYPFLEELLWFEWIELELYMMEDKVADYTLTGDILFSKLVLNPEHILVSFQYPVHKKNCKYITLSDKNIYYVLAHRNKDGDVLFNDLAPALVRMIEYLTDAPFSIKDLFSSFQSEYKIEITAEDQKHIISFFENAYQQNLIIGFKN